MSARTFSSWRPVRTVIAALSAFSVVYGAALPAFAEDQVSLLRDTEIEEIMHQEADPLLIAAGIKPKDVRILLVGDKTLNAFATQGLMLGFNTGLIMETETPNQLKGVMAHETGHLAGAHPLRSGDMQNAGLRPMLLTMGLGVLAMLAGAPDAGAVLIGNSGYFGTLGALGYSREQEGRADQAAVGFLEASGQSGRGLVEFFDKFRYQEVFQEARRFPYFRSHPLSSERIELLRSRVEKQKHYDVVDTPEEIERHEIMKAKIVGFTTPQAALVKYPETDKSFHARYARAISYYRLKDVNRAVSLVDDLLKEQPDNPYLWELKGQMLFEFARTKEAEYPQRRSVELKPNAPLLRINLGQTLINLGDPQKRDEGIEELKRALLDEDIPDAWRLLAQAYDARGDEGLARLATAEYYYGLGGLNEARVFAMRARELLDKDSVSWRRATDIVLTANPSNEDLKDLARDTPPTRQ
ncbi:MAG: M48 family metallopeptidase [Caulobacter sp.]|nr:M48 family metallopeptidase [Caulobacter sp.]